MARQSLHGIYFPLAFFIIFLSIHHCGFQEQSPICKKGCRRKESTNSIPAILTASRYGCAMFNPVPADAGTSTNTLKTIESRITVSHGPWNYVMGHVNLPNASEGKQAGTREEILEEDIHMRSIVMVLEPDKSCNPSSITAS